MKRIVWKATAGADLRRIRAWLLTIEGAKPARAIARIRAMGDRLATSDIGRDGREAGTREVSVPGVPYVLVYVVLTDRVNIIAVFHTSEDR